MQLIDIEPGYYLDGWLRASR